MIDHCRVVAELRAQELVAALQAAVDGVAQWRPRAKALLHSIADLELPPQVTEAMHAIDTRKRMAECMADIALDDCSG